MNAFKVIIALVYFGRLPAHFQLWLNSCERNAGFDWIVLTDDPTSFRWPANVCRIGMTFDQMRERLGRHASVENLVIPYKLCDYKPLYGLALEDLFAGYDVWGYCDADMIFGDISALIPPQVLASHVKIFKRGHLSLMRNTEEINRIWTGTPDRVDAVTIDKVVATPKTLAFDESTGVFRIYLARNLPIFTEEVALDISGSSYRMTMIPFLRELERPHQAFYWDRGRVIQRYLDEGLEVRERQFCYIHFKRRTMSVNVPLDSERYWITSGGFRRIESLPTTPREFAAINGPSPVRDAAIRLGTKARKLRRLVSRRRLV